MNATSVHEFTNNKLISPEVELPLLTKASQKRSDYLLLIQARLNGWSGCIADKAERLELSTQTVTSFMNGHAEGFSLSQLIAIAKKAGVAVSLKPRN